jgi:hypothetical protein
MTTFQAFQDEIEDIHSREVAKQRDQALNNMSIEKEKATSKPGQNKGKGKEIPAPGSPTATTTQEPTSPVLNKIDRGDMAESEEKVLVCDRDP